MVLLCSSAEALQGCCICHVYGVAPLSSLQVALDYLGLWLCGLVSEAIPSTSGRGTSFVASPFSQYGAELHYLFFFSLLGAITVFKETISWILVGFSAGVWRLPCVFAWRLKSWNGSLDGTPFCSKWGMVPSGALLSWQWQLVLVLF